MGSLRDEEVRRLLKHLRRCVDDNERLAEIEEELRGEFGEELLREPDLLIHFPELSDEFIAADVRWNLRVIPHAHLRMIQRGIKLGDVSALFHRFIKTYAVSGQTVIEGHYSIVGRPKSRAATLTVRADVDHVTDQRGQAHVVTVFIGRGSIEGRIEVSPP